MKTLNEISGIVSFFVQTAWGNTWCILFLRTTDNYDPLWAAAPWVYLAALCSVVHWSRKKYQRQQTQGPRDIIYDIVRDAHLDTAIAVDAIKNLFLRVLRGVTVTALGFTLQLYAIRITSGAVTPAALSVATFLVAIHWVILGIARGHIRTIVVFAIASFLAAVSITGNHSPMYDALRGLGIAMECIAFVSYRHAVGDITATMHDVLLKIAISLTTTLVTAAVPASTNWLSYVFFSLFSGLYLFAPAVYGPAAATRVRWQFLVLARLLSEALTFAILHAFVPPAEGRSTAAFAAVAVLFALGTPALVHDLATSQDEPHPPTWPVHQSMQVLQSS